MSIRSSRATCLLLVAMILALPVRAGMSEALDAYDRGDFAAAIVELAPLAESGNAEASFYLGYLYENGLGVERDEIEGTRLYRVAAEQGNVRAQFNLGLAYQVGRGVDADPAAALEWYGAAADQGFARAQYKLGDMYEQGLGVKRPDPILAYQWFTLAARQKYEDAKRRRNQIADKMTPYQIAEADMHVRHWRETHRD